MRVLDAYRLPMTDLSYGISVKLADKKYRHYKYSLRYFLDMQAAEDKYQEIILSETARQLREELGEPVELNVLEAHYRNPNEPIAIDRTLFSKKTIDALEKRAVKSTLMLEEVDTSKIPTFLKMIDGIASFINRSIIIPFNRLLFRLFAPKDADVLFCRWLLPLLKETFYYNSVKRVIYPTVTLTVGCGEEDLEQAIQKLSSDLDRLETLKLIKGHLLMPSVMEQVNTAGNGKKVYIVFTIPVIDSGVLNRIVAKDADLWHSEEKLRGVGISSVIREGDHVNWLNGVEPYQDEVESTVTADSNLSQDDIRKALIEAFEAEKGAVAKPAQLKLKGNKKDIGNVKNN